MQPRSKLSASGLEQHREGSSSSTQAYVEVCIKALLDNDSLRLSATLGMVASTARLEVQSLLQATLQVNRAHLLTYPEQVLSVAQYSNYSALITRRLLGEPLAYLLGWREFYELKFKVTTATLIPRQETELLVELALQRIPAPAVSFAPRHKEAEPASAQADKFRVLDLGTGSGAIALSIAHARPDAEVMAVDASAAALEVARFNAQQLGLKNVRLLYSDWFSALPGERYHVIVANPPYIAAGDAHLSQGDVCFEPRGALISGATGLDDIERICAQAKAHLHEQGWLLLEHGYDQAARVRTLLQQAGLKQVFSAQDMADIERVSGGLC